MPAQTKHGRPNHDHRSTQGSEPSGSSTATSRRKSSTARSTKVPSKDTNMGVTKSISAAPAAENNETSQKSSDLKPMVSKHIKESKQDDGVNQHITEESTEGMNRDKPSEPPPETITSTEGGGDQKIKLDQTEENELPPSKEETPKTVTKANKSSAKNFDMQTFTSEIDNFTEIFSSEKYTQTVDDDYPVDDLIMVVSSVSTQIEEYKQQTMSSQQQLENLKQRMAAIKESLQMNIQKKRFQVRIDEEQSIEERELTKKLARLNAEVAKANTELAEAVRLAAETESTAVEAELAAERAKEEAERIQEEIKFKAQVEEKRRQEEIKKMEEVRRMREEEERRAEEARRAKEAEWKRRDVAAEKTHAWEKWPIYEYKIGSDFGCIIRACPSKFKESDVTCRLIDRLDCPLHFEQHQELVSNIIQIEPTYPEYKLQVDEYVQEPTSSRYGDYCLDESQIQAEEMAEVMVAIPYVSQRNTAASREPVIKAFINGHWKEIETTDTVFDSHKDMKFAQIETPSLTTFAVFTRLKRDYVSVSKRGGKVTSSVDQRITITVPKDAIKGKDLMLMEVQPVDTGSVNEIRLRTPACRGLLAASPIIRTSWESSEFQKPLTITIPCPPNPARAKKLAAMRKLKEEKMKNPPKVVIKLPHEEEKEKEEKRKKIEELRQAQKQQQGQGQQPEGEVVEKKQARWYMGEYGSNEDDENDHLYLVSGSSSDRWTVIPEVKVIQVKLDLLQFDLDRPLDSFMVLRTRTNVEPDQVAPMAHQLTGLLAQKFAQVILKQRSDDPFDTVLQVVHVSKTDKTLKRLSEEGYDDGPEPSPAVAINEGDVIEVSFRGNVKSTQDEDELKFVYNSNMESETEFQASEVDRYLQKNFPMFRGVVEVYKKYPVRNSKKLRRRDSTEEMDTTPVETKKELLCELPLTVPKYHVEPNKSPRRAPITIVNDRDPINEQLMRQLAEEMGDEWKTVAYLLNVSKARVQAIQRNVNVYDQPEEDARFDMLMTWLKKMPKATDKVTILSNAFLRCGRGDLAEEIRARDREFRQGQVSR